jgi:type II secretory pathway component PulM
MIAAMVGWWRTRSSRERLLLQVAAFLIFAILVPFAAYQAAVRYRAGAAADLAGARQVQADVARLAAQGARPASGAVASDGTLRGRAMANAEASGLTVARIEPQGAGRFLIVFEPADSLKVYRWIDSMSKSGVDVRRTSITRASAEGAVTAEFEISTDP